jgi:hypothetical protein
MIEGFYFLFGFSQTILLAKAALLIANFKPGPEGRGN